MDQLQANLLTDKESTETALFRTQAHTSASARALPVRLPTIAIQLEW